MAKSMGKTKSKKDDKKITKVRKGGAISRGKSKATKAKINKLNEQFDRSVLEQRLDKQSDIQAFKEELKKDKQKKVEDKKVENDILQQLDMLTGIGI